MFIFEDRVGFEPTEPVWADPAVFKTAALIQTPPPIRNIYYSRQKRKNQHRKCMRILCAVFANLLYSIVTMPYKHVKGHERRPSGPGGKPSRVRSHVRKTSKTKSPSSAADLQNIASVSDSHKSGADRVDAIQTRAHPTKLAGRISTHSPMDMAASFKRELYGNEQDVAALVQEFKEKTFTSSANIEKMFHSKKEREELEWIAVQLVMHKDTKPFAEPIIRAETDRESEVRDWMVKYKGAPPPSTKVEFTGRLNEINAHQSSSPDAIIGAINEYCSS